MKPLMNGLYDESGEEANNKIGANGRRKFKNRTFNLDNKPQIDSSADMVAKTLAMSASFTNVEGCLNGVLQFDADTMFPYTVMDYSLDSNGSRGTKKGGLDGTNARGGGKQQQPFFNLVVVHDIFDTAEKVSKLANERSSTKGRFVTFYHSTLEQSRSSLPRVQSTVPCGAVLAQFRSNFVGSPKNLTNVVLTETLKAKANYKRSFLRSSWALEKPLIVS